MWGMNTKRIATCKTSVSVKISGILKFLGQSKFGGSQLLEHLNHAGVYTALATVEH
jgi:hypothetical protein